MCVVVNMRHFHRVKCRQNIIIHKAEYTELCFHGKSEGLGNKQFVPMKGWHIL